MIVFRRNDFSRDGYVIFITKSIYWLHLERNITISMIKVIKVIIIIPSIDQIKRKYVIQSMRVF